MSGAADDLIAGYLAELGAGLRGPTEEAELILAEAEDHLRETAAAGLAVGMTEQEAEQAAISSFGPVRAVVRAHRRRAVTAGHAAMAAWKLAALLATTVGAGGLAVVFLTTTVGAGALATMFLLHSHLTWYPGARVVSVGGTACQCSIGRMTIINPAVMALPFAAMAAGGLALLAGRRRRAGRRGFRLPASPGLLLCPVPVAARVWHSAVAGYDRRVAARRLRHRRGLDRF